MKTVDFYRFSVYHIFSNTDFIGSMDDPILVLSDRGQLTIPKAFRKKIPFKRFIGTIEKGQIILKPLQTREEFIQELEEAEKDWEKNGGTTLEEMKKKYNLK